MNNDQITASNSATSTVPEAMPPEDRKAIAKEILLQASSALPKSAYRTQKTIALTITPLRGVRPK
jgi:hypothetical protein